MNTKLMTLTLAFVLGLGVMQQAQGMQEPGKTNPNKQKLEEGQPQSEEKKQKLLFNAKATNDLFAACELQDHQRALELAQKAIANSADVNATNFYSATPLHRACFKGHTEIVKLLLAKNADVSAKTKGGWTPLLWACNWDHLEIVKLLLVAGAQIEQKDIDVADNQQTKGLCTALVTWEKVKKGQLQVDDRLIQQEMQRIATTQAWAIVALLRPGLARTVLRTLEHYDQTNASNVLRAVVTAYFANTNPQQLLCSLKRMAQVAHEQIRPSLSTTYWHECLDGASEDFKKELVTYVQGPWNGHRKATNGLMHALVNEQKCDAGFVF